MGVVAKKMLRQMVEIHYRIIGQYPRDCTMYSGQLVILTLLIKPFLLTRQRLLGVFACNLNQMSIAVIVFLFLSEKSVEMKTQIVSIAAA